MLSSTISGKRRDRLGAGVIEPVAGVHFEAEALRQLRALADAPPLGLGRRPCRRRTAPGTRRRCGSRSPARPAPPRSRSACGSAAMNSDTRMPAARSAAIRGPSSARWPAASRPPSVVRSARRSGTRQAACGRVRTAISIISGVAAISRLSGLSMPALRRAISSSLMWRRSSRRCAVMPSAPASIASLAARTGSGCRPPRALRMVAT